MPARKQDSWAPKKSLPKKHVIFSPPSTNKNQSQCWSKKINKKKRSNFWAPQVNFPQTDPQKSYFPYMLTTIPTHHPILPPIHLTRASLRSLGAAINFQPAIVQELSLKDLNFPDKQPFQGAGLKIQNANFGWLAWLVCMSVLSVLISCTLPETNSSPLKIGRAPKGN